MPVSDFQKKLALEKILVLYHQKFQIDTHSKNIEMAYVGLILDYFANFDD